MSVRIDSDDVRNRQDNADWKVRTERHEQVCFEVTDYDFVSLEENESAADPCSPVSARELDCTRCPEECGMDVKCEMMP